LLALVRAAMGDCGGQGHLWVTVDINRDPAASDNVLISQRLECADSPAQEWVITLYHPRPTPAEAGMSSHRGRQSRSAAARLIPVPETAWPVVTRTGALS
jgi:hypothetical protein